LEELLCVRVAAGKAILLPLLNADCSFLTNPNLKTESQLLSCAKSENEGVTGLDATIDGGKIQGLQNYRVQSPLFNITIPDNNIAGSKPGTTQAVSDGYWVLLKPLSVGSHTIEIYESDMIVPVSFGIEHRKMLSDLQMLFSNNMVAVPPQFDDLILDLRIARTSAEGKVEKTASAQLDLFDSLRLCTKHYHFE